MCTVTFLPLSDTDFVLTSSRDVGYHREKALVPATYEEHDVSLHYPKDGKAGGTWIGTSRGNRLICLLNGGFKDHIQEQPYARSRGLVVKELLIAASFGKAIAEIELSHIEPFTLVVVEWDREPRLSQFVWDGHEKHLEELKWQPSIWSSSTLYTEEMKSMRKAWFETWFRVREMTPQEALDFHQFAGIGKEDVDVFMRREKVGTVSITQVFKTENWSVMDYFPCPLDQKGDK